MSVQKFMDSMVNNTPMAELKATFSRFEESGLSKGSSLKGRAICLLLIPAHTAGIVLKPIGYTVASIVVLSVTILLDTKNVLTGQRHRIDGSMYKDIVLVFVTAFVTPVGQVAQVAKAVAGVIHPGAYFKEPLPVLPFTSSFSTYSSPAPAYNPPSSPYVPSPSSYVPPASSYVPPSSSYVPSPSLFGSTYVPPSHYSPFDGLPSLSRYPGVDSIPGYSSYTSPYSFGGLDAASGRSVDLSLSQEGVALDAHNGTYQVNCAFDAPVRDPNGTLHQLASGIRQSRAGQFRVSYTGQRGIDAGGLRADFMSRLMENVAKKHDLQENVIQWTSANEQVLKDLGTVLKMQLKGIKLIEDPDTDVQTQAAQPCGEVFNPGYFKGMLNYTHDQIKADFDFIIYEEMVDIIAEFVPEDQKDFLKKVRALAEWDGSDLDGEVGQKHLETIQYAQDMLGCEMPGEEAGWTPEKGPKAFNDDGKLNIDALWKIKDTIMDDVFAVEKNKAKALHTIGHAMNCTKETWDLLRIIGADGVRTHVQGTFSKEKLKDCITFTGFTDSEKDRVLAFIDAQSDDELKRFVATITGSKAIPVGGIELKRGPYHTEMLAHTCFKNVDIPQSWDMDRVIANFGGYCAADAEGFARG